MNILKKNKLLLAATMALALSGYIPTCYSANKASPKASPIETAEISGKHALLFAYEAILLSAYNYSFVNYENQLKTTSHYFMPEAWEKFKPVLDQSTKSHFVIENKLVVFSVSTKPPVILKEGVKNGIYTWKVQMPISVTYENATTSINEPLVLTMDIIRTFSAPTEEQKLVIKDITVTKP